MTRDLHKEIRLVNNQYFAQAAERLASGTAVRLSVMGNSMLPFIIGGKDQVTLVPYTGQDLPLGIAALYQWEGKYMIHRLVKKDESHYHFLGDGNICRFETIKRNEVLGILQTIHHPDGKETDTTGRCWLHLGMIWYHIRPVRRYLLFIFRKLFLRNGR